MSASCQHRFCIFDLDIVELSAIPLRNRLFFIWQTAAKDKLAV